MKSLCETKAIQEKVKPEKNSGWRVLIEWLSAVRI